MRINKRLRKLEGRAVMSILFVFVLALQSHADIRLHGLFTDHMVVQRETEIEIWGWADPSEEISIEASWGAKAHVVARSDSTWRAKLKTSIAGGPHQIKFSGKNTIILRDVLSGEVWLCTGQSNMDWELSKFLRDAREPQYQPLVEYLREEVATAYDPWLRHIAVPRDFSLAEKKSDFEGEWGSVNPAQNAQISATGYFYAKELRKHLDIPVAIIECSVGGSRLQPWISKEVYMADPHLKRYYENEFERVNVLTRKYTVENFVDTTVTKRVSDWETNGKKGRKPRLATYPAVDMQIPTTLYNAMLSAVIPYTIKGIIWYQGESNAGHLANEYSYYLEKMISSWREEWGLGDIPFYWTQLAGCQRGTIEAEHGWAVVNDQLRRSMKLPNTGMAVLHDIGEAKDIHPHNKMDVGNRLALWALSRDYGVNVDAVSGPLYASKEVLKRKIVIRFDSVGSGLMAGEKVLLKNAVEVNKPLTWFEIAGKNGIWEKAIATIIDKDKIEVSSPNVSRPLQVRYAWYGNPSGANLYNKEGLPAAVFTTE